MSGTDDLFGDDPELEEASQEFDRHREALFQLISDYMDEEQIAALSVIEMLISTVVGLRMTVYGVSVESPSVTGLKRDLERLGREIDDCIRHAKKEAEQFVTHIKQARAEADEEEADTDAEREPPNR